MVSHGPLAQGLIGAAEMIVGAQMNLHAVSMGAAADMDHLRSEIESAVQAVGGANSALVLVDLLGGSPSNASAYLAADRHARYLRGQPADAARIVDGA